VSKNTLCLPHLYKSQLGQMGTLWGKYLIGSPADSCNTRPEFNEDYIVRITGIFNKIPGFMYKEYAEILREKLNVMKVDMKQNTEALKPEGKQKKEKRETNSAKIDKKTQEVADPEASSNSKKESQPKTPDRNNNFPEGSITLSSEKAPQYRPDNLEESLQKAVEYTLFPKLWNSGVKALTIFLTGNKKQANFRCDKVEYEDLLYWAIVCGKLALAKVIWEKTKMSIHTALIASGLCRGVALWMLSNQEGFFRGCKLV